MGTRNKKKQTTTFGAFEKQFGRLRKDLDKAVDRVTREASRVVPKATRRQLNDALGVVSSVGGDVTRRVTKAVDGVRSEVEGNLEQLRGTVNQRVRTLRKDATQASEKAVADVEKEVRKQAERLFKVLGLPVKSDLDSLKRRIGAVERKIEELVEGSARKRAKAEASEAA